MCHWWLIKLNIVIISIKFKFTLDDLGEKNKINLRVCNKILHIRKGVFGN